MKVVFAGPSIAGAQVDWMGLVRLPPARCGDILKAAEGGATAIGLIDGFFEQSASVWHKEILFALSHGIPVLGASSMGALRAAECAAYGMVPIGTIAHRYLSGELNDDAAVALASAPSEFGYTPWTEPLVNVEATLNRLEESETCPQSDIDAVRQKARILNFAERTVEAISAAVPDPDRMIRLYRLYYRDVKREDALELIAVIKHTDAGVPRQDWIFRGAPLWRKRMLEFA